MNAKSLLLIGVASLTAFAGCESRNQTGTPPSAPASPSQSVPKTAVAPAQPAATPATRAEATPTTGPKPWMIGAEQGLKPTLFVATFENKSDDNLPWAAIVSDILRIKLNYAPCEILSIPAMRFAFPEFRFLRRGAQMNDSHTVDEAIRLARIFGVGCALTGLLEKRGETLCLIAQIRDAKSSEVLTRFSVEGTVDQAPAMISQFCLRVVDSLTSNTDPSLRAYLSRPTPATGRLLQREVALEAQEPTTVTLSDVAAQKEIWEADPTFVLAKVIYVNLLSDISPEKSLAEVKRFHEADPHEGRLWELYIRKLDDCDQDTESIHQCFEFLKENPNNLTILWQLARLYSKTTKFEEALSVGTRLVELAPDNFRAHWMRGLVASDWGWARRGGDYWVKVPADGQIIFPLMMKLCCEEYEKTVKINPNNPYLLANLAATYIQTGASESEIESLCRKALEIDPDNWDAYTTLLLYYWPGYSRQHEKALALCREAAAKYQKGPNAQWLTAYYLLWYIDFNHSQTGTSITEFMKKPEITQAIEQSMERALALQPNNKEWNARAAYYYAAYKGAPDKAWAYYAKATDYVPVDWRKPDFEWKWWYCVVNAAVQTKHWDDVIPAARKELVKCPLSEPSREYILVYLAYAHEKRKEFDEAMNCYTEVVKIDKFYKGFACGQLGVVILENKPDLMEQGFEYAKQGVALSPKEVGFRRVLARYYQKRGDREAALKEIDAALALSPNSGSAKKIKAEILAMPK